MYSPSTRRTLGSAPWPTFRPPWRSQCAVCVRVYRWLACTLTRAPPAPAPLFGLSTLQPHTTPCNCQPRSLHHTPPRAHTALHFHTTCQLTTSSLTSATKSVLLPTRTAIASAAGNNNKKHLRQKASHPRLTHRLCYCETHWCHSLPALIPSAWPSQTCPVIPIMHAKR